MLFPTDHPRTIADVILIVEHADLPATRRRDLASALKRISKMAGHQPDFLLLDVTGLRQALAGIRPAAHGIAKQTFANLRSNFTAALEIAGVIDRSPRGLAKRDPFWEPLMVRLTSLSLYTGLAAFLNWCAYRGVTPDAVDDETVQAFQVWLETRTLCPKPHDPVRRVPKLWAEARRTVADWPDRALAPLSFKPPLRHLAWKDLPDSFRHDAETYFATREKPDLFDDNPHAPRRPLAPSTLRQQREHLRLSGSILIEQGRPIEKLADLVEPDAFKTIIRHYHEQAGGKPNAFAIALSQTLIQIARHYIRVDEARLAKLRTLARKLPDVPCDLSDKNKALLRQFESKDLQARLFYLPENLIEEVSRHIEASQQNEDRPLRFVDAQVAIAVDIALVAPLRPQNLARLNWRRHFREPDGARGRLILHIPAEETKTGKRELIFEIPPDVAQRIRWYRLHILTRLNADPDGDLFVVRSGGPKSQTTLSQQITETIKARVGVHMTPHQFRHLAAVLYLEDHPEDFETVRALLGHSFSKTTLIYAGHSSQRASRAYSGFVTGQREALKISGRKPRRARKAKSALSAPMRANP